MVAPAELISNLANMGATIAADGVTAPRQLWTPELRDAVGRHKPLLQVLYRLRMGQRWLTEQHERYLEEDRRAVPDDLFSRKLDTWIRSEDQLRAQYGYEGCLLGPGEHCPQDGPVICQACSGPRDNPL